MVGRSPPLALLCGWVKYRESWNADNDEEGFRDIGVNPTFVSRAAKYGYWGAISGHSDLGILKHLPILGKE
jgi:hypothetical protein